MTIIESTEIEPHLYGLLISAKALKLLDGERKNLFNKWC